MLPASGPRPCPGYCAPTISSSLKSSSLNCLLLKSVAASVPARPATPYKSSIVSKPTLTKSKSSKLCEVGDDLQCTHCGKRILIGSFSLHQQLCGDRLKVTAKEDEDERVAISVTRELLAEDGLLSSCQVLALQYVQSVASRSSLAAEPRLLARFKLLGYAQGDLSSTLWYIKMLAPIVVHVDLDTVLEPLLSDRYLRNQFETKTSKGAMEPDHRSRRVWEHAMFHGAYDHSSPFERVKYGSINITNDPHGIKACLPYGDSYLVLKNVRFRTTFCSTDSSTKGLSVHDMATCEHYAHVLNQYADVELDALIQVATKRRTYLPSELYVKTYKEAQIAGPILLEQDVEALVVHARHTANPKRVDQLYQFAQKNKCDLLWMIEDKKKKM